MKLINPILLTLNNTLHIKADNLEPVEVDSSCVDELEEIIIKKWSSDRITSLTFDNYLKEGINISELSDRIQIVRDVNCPVGSPKAFLIPEKEDKCKCFRLGEGSKWQTYNCEIHNENLNECLEIVDKKSYTIEEIKEALKSTKKLGENMEKCKNEDLLKLCILAAKNIVSITNEIK